VGIQKEVTEILAEIVKDAAFFQHSGGGMTLSGGEPLAQFDFCFELLSRAKAEGVHTAVETSGYVDKDKLDQLRRVVDLFLFDYKCTDPAEHALHTGVSNERIVSNLDFLASSGCRIILRCPMIPGVNDTVAHLNGIADLGRKYRAIEKIEVMPYHDYAIAKAERFGMNVPAIESNAADDEQVADWLGILSDLGCSMVSEG